MIELKILYSPSDVEKGIKQISDYMDRMGETIGWLVIFDRKSDKSWDEKLYWNTEKEDRRTVHIVGV